MKQESRANHAVELVAVTFSAVLLGGASALSQPRIPDTPGFSYFPITTPNSGSFQVTVAWDGNFWFTEQNGNSIGKVTPDGSITEFPIPTPFSFPALITSCPDGSIWFTEAAANQIGRVARDGTITEFPVLTPNSGPFGIACRLNPSDGHIDIVFTEASANQIGWIRHFPDHDEMTEYGLPAPIRTPAAITFSSDGNVWFTGFIGSDTVAQMTPSGAVTAFTTPTTPSAPLGITPGPDGGIWFTEYLGNKIGTITPAGTITEVSIPTPNSQPFGITWGPDGKVWFTEQGAGKVGAITLDGSIQEWPLTLGGGPSGIAGLAVTTPVPTGYIVIMQADANTVAIGRTDLPAIEFTKTASPDPVPVGGVLTYTLTVTNRHSVLLSACTIIDYPASGTTPLLQDGWTTVSGDNVYTFSDSITIAVGETKVLQLRVSADVAGDLLNRAELNCFAHIAGIATVTSRAQ